MKEQTVELIRRFTPIHAKAADLAASTFDTSRTIRWNEIEREHRVLILADVGAGKTFEARERARRLRNRRQCAFFIRIEAIDAEFEAAFEIGSAADFKCWLTSVDEGYFFLDSVDEAQLGTPRALEEAIRIFGTRIHAALARAR
ncbi:hypothetical protein, partial [uncultured Methylobacterium sp.]|uniref:hypothetical protein n=1 Tax=uncultured Methylobacterium sp. TaxID=157278 RepID=UPI00260748BB